MPACLTTFWRLCLCLFVADPKFSRKCWSSLIKGNPRAQNSYSATHLYTDISHLDLAKVRAQSGADPFKPKTTRVLCQNKWFEPRRANPLKSDSMLLHHTQADLSSEQDCIRNKAQRPRLHSPD